MADFTGGQGRDMGVLKLCALFFRSMLIPKAHLAVENLALRQQVTVFKESVKRPKLRPRDRVFWVWLSRIWPSWRTALVIVQPETIKHRVLLRTPTKQHLFVGQVVHHAATCVACVQTQVETPRHLASTLDDALHETSRALSRVELLLGGALPE